MGDRERAETDTRLRAAHDEGLLTLVEYDERSRECFAARFRRDLDALVVDLPGASTPPPTGGPPRVDTTKASPAPAPAPPSPPPERHDGHGRRGLGRFVPLAVVVAAVAIVGPGVLGADQGAAIFGSRTVSATSGDVGVGVLFGSATVIVPDGTRVTTSGLMLFGSTDCDQACSAPLPPNAPQVAVSGRGAFGSVEVETATEAARGGLDHRDADDRDSDDRDDD